MPLAADQSGDIRQHSGWLIPLGFVLVVALLSALVLLYDLRPGPRDGQPTGDAHGVAISIQGLNLQVPANYIRAAAARRGGAVQSLSLTTLLPGMTGYSDAQGRLFATNAPDSPVLFVQLRSQGNSMTPEARLVRIYRSYIQNPAGSAGPFGLVRYDFLPGSAYSRSELFAGQGARGLVLLECEKPAPDLPSPNCIAADRPLDNGVNLSYRFKRAYLARWKSIASGVDGLLTRFTVQRR